MPPALHKESRRHFLFLFASYPTNCTTWQRHSPCSEQQNVPQPMPARIIKAQALLGKEGGDMESPSSSYLKEMHLEGEKLSLGKNKLSP